MPHRPVRTVLIGFGHGGSVFHAPLIQHDPGLDLAVVVTPSPGRRDAARTAYPAAQVAATLDDALRAVPDLVLAVIATPHASHAPLAAAALGRGLHVVVDKPFVVHVDDGKRLIDAARAVGKLLVPFHNRRWDGDFLTVQTVVRSGSLGGVRIFESAMESWKPSISKPWKRDAGPADGGGVLYDLGSHLIDQALTLFGPAVPVYAELRNDRGGAAEDSAFLVLRHDGGVTSRLHAGTLAPLARPRFHLTGARSGLTITGSDPQEALLTAGVRPDGPADAAGALMVPPRGLMGRDGATEVLAVGPGRYPDFYAGLVAAIHGDGPPPVQVDDALDVVRLIEQVHAAYPSRPQGT
ncbi:Gfo/Idh/MocA family oxidoreductase [Arthrobacter sp. SX1312]|uniref:Gfo/Idh/MocA family protein n=1 Tax=Arthrobacter sp. SX1312 TaxID=2058896 RepID=UPI000CE44CE1|nr:Gfo/Idh/MocA family oxidoreductase [Arthrobacter sp. SX1312]